MMLWGVLRFTGNKSPWVFSASAFFWWEEGSWGGSMLLGAFLVHISTNSFGPAAWATSSSLADCGAWHKGGQQVTIAGAYLNWRRDGGNRQDSLTFALPWVYIATADRLRQHSRMKQCISLSAWPADCRLRCSARRGADEPRIGPALVLRDYFLNFNVLMGDFGNNMQ